MIPFAPICWAGFGLIWVLRPWLDARPEAAHAQGRFGTALHSAAWERQLECARLLVERGADPTVTNEDGQTALDIARKREFPEIIAYFESLTDGTEVPHANH